MISDIDTNVMYVKRFDEQNGKTKTLVKDSSLPESSSPLLNALIRTNLFSIKNTDYNKSYEEEFKIYRQGVYMFSEKAKLSPESPSFHYKNQLVQVASLMPLDMRAFDLLIWLLERFQKSNSNKIVFHISEVFDYLGYKPHNRKPNEKEKVASRLLSLSTIVFRLFVKELTEKLKTPEEFFSYQKGRKRTCFFTLFNIEYDHETATFKSVCSDNLYQLYRKSKWNMINIKEYKLLSTSAEKAVYKYLVFRDPGVDTRMGMSLDLFYEMTGLSDYDKYAAKKKLKSVLRKFCEINMIRGFEIKSNKVINIDLITSKERKVIEQKNKKPKDKDKPKKEKNKSDFDDEIDFSGSYDFL